MIPAEQHNPRRPDADADAADDAAPLAVRLFGPFAATVGDGRPLPRLRTRKGQWLLALLALRAGREVERDFLAATLWPDSEERQALANLRLALTDLRAALGEAAPRLVAPRPRALLLAVSPDAVDVLAFDAAVARGGARAWERAVALYRGPLLEGCAEEWAIPEREARGLAFLTALEGLADDALSRGDPATAARYWGAVVAAAPLRDSAQRALMTAHARAGDPAAALQTYRRHRAHLRRELGTEPDPETRALLRALRADAHRRAATVTVPAAVPSSPPLVPAPRRAGTPPAPQRTSYVGRERECAALTSLLAPDCGDDAVRLVTLTGEGGCGKTRLALRVAERLLGDAYPDGVWAVELAPLAEPGRVPQAVASALGIAEQPGRPLTETVADRLGDRAALLVLDNAEHLLDAAATLADRLLARCPRLRLLITSRERLGLVGEYVLRVPPLDAPDPADAPGLGPDGAMHHAAVRLFVERAAHARPDFRLAEGDLPAVARVCRRLDGNPLAIELAAARTRVLSVAQIDARLDDRFRLLSGGDRAASPRQQTLRAAMDWSHDLLTEPERLLLRRLSVFAGGCTLEAAEAVCAGEGIDAADVLDLLTGLADKSLIVPEDGGGGAASMRYRLLETVRQYGRGRLSEAGEAARLRRRHRDWFANRAEAAAAHLWDADGPAWLALLESVHDDLRAALDVSDEGEDGGEVALRLAGALAEFWYLRGYWTEGRERLDDLLSRGHRRATYGRAKALTGAGILAWNLDDYRGARTRLEESVALWESLGHAGGRADAAMVLGSVLGTLGEYAAADRLLEEARAYFAGVGIERDVAFCLAYRARFAFERREYDAARALSEECLTLARRIGHRWCVAFALTFLGSIAGKEGDYARSDALCGEAITISEGLGNRRGAARARHVSGLVACRRGDHAAARALLEGCRAEFADLGDKEGVAYALEGLALEAALSGDRQRARELYASAASLREEIGVPLPPSSRAMRDTWLLGAEAARSTG